MNNKQGFTLIELLVVIAIIAVLVAFAVANFVGARSRAFDIKKKSELQQVKNALRLYYNDFQSYPGPDSSKGTNTFDGCGDVTTPAGCTKEFKFGSTIYMKQLPNYLPDNWYYQQESGGDDFCLWTPLNDLSDSDISGSQARCESACGGLIISGSINKSTDYVSCAD
jgi:prepilin-type N-terminal cleavage/methylation domain-containing protein